MARAEFTELNVPRTIATPSGPLWFDRDGAIELGSVRHVLPAALGPSCIVVVSAAGCAFCGTYSPRIDALFVPAMTLSQIAKLSRDIARDDPGMFTITPHTTAYGTLIEYERGAVMLDESLNQLWTIDWKTYDVFIANVSAESVTVEGEYLEPRRYSLIDGRRL